MFLVFKVAHCAELDISLTGLVLAATLTATAAVTNTNTVRVMVHTNLRSDMIVAVIMGTGCRYKDNKLALLWGEAQLCLP